MRAMPSSSLRWFAAFLAVVAALAGVEIYSLVAHNRERAAAVPQATAPAKATAAGPIGAIDSPAERGDARSARHHLRAGRSTRQAFAPSRFASTAARSLRVSESRVPTSRRQSPPFRTTPTAATSSSATSRRIAMPAGADRRVLSVVAVAKRRPRIGARHALPDRACRDDALVRVHARRTQRRSISCPRCPVSTWEAPRSSTRCTRRTSRRRVRVGFRVPILYLRTTKGAAADYVVRPRLGSRRASAASGASATTPSTACSRTRGPSGCRCSSRSTAASGPTRFATFPQWDVNDKLEQDARNCQWNEHNEVMPDDFLKIAAGLAGGARARALADVQRLCDRSAPLQEAQPAAGRARCSPRSRARTRTCSSASTSIRTRTSIRSSRSSSGTTTTPARCASSANGSPAPGPYAGRRGGRRARPARVSARAAARRWREVNRIAGQRWRSWSEVDPPRTFSRDAARPFWKDPWVREWEAVPPPPRRSSTTTSSRSGWSRPALSRDRIWSSQGLMAPRGDAMSFAIDLASPPRNYDSGGMTIAGSKPALGHLGVILYGEAAVNDVPMDNGKSLFATLAAIDPQWAVVEYNTADLRELTVPPTYVAGVSRLARPVEFRCALRVARWPGTAATALLAGQPGYSTYTAWRNTPLEAATRDFMLARAGLAAGRAAVDLRHARRTPTATDGPPSSAGSRSAAAFSRSPRMRTAASRSSRRAGLPATAQRADDFVLGLDAARRACAACACRGAGVRTAAGRRWRTPPAARSRAPPRASRSGARRERARRRSISCASS